MENEYDIPVSKEAKAQDQQVHDVVANFLKPAARERLNRVYIVNPTRAKQIESIILNQAETGEVGVESVTEEQIKQMLEAISNPTIEGSRVVVGSIDECTGEGKVVLQNRVDVEDNVQNLGGDELSF